MLRVSHRVVVLRDRRLVADLPNDNLDLDTLLALIAEGAEVDETAGAQA